MLFVYMNMSGYGGVILSVYPHDGLVGYAGKKLGQTLQLLEDRWTFLSIRGFNLCRICEQH